MPRQEIGKMSGGYLSLLEDAFLWRGLRSYVFHLGAESETGPMIRGLKAVLSHPGLCYTLEELSAKDASHVMEKEFSGMKTDLHAYRIGKKRIHKERSLYGEELMELCGAVRRADEKIFRVKVLIDAGRIDRRSVREILGRVDDLRSGSVT